MSRENLDNPPTDLNPDKLTDETPTRVSHSTINIIDPGGEVRETSEVLSKDIHDLDNHAKGEH